MRLVGVVSLAGAAVAAWSDAGMDRPLAAAAAVAAPARVTRAAWRRVEASDPRMGAALMQPALSDRSDIGIVGMIVRCREGRLEPVIVLVDPLPPGTPSRVEIVAAGRSETLDATLIPTGAGLALPIAIADRLATAWRHEPDLDVTVRARSDVVRGVIALKGLAGQLPPFEAACRQASDAPPGLPAAGAPRP